MTQNFDPAATVQTINFDPDDFKFCSPFAMSVTGPSQSGKSEFIVELLKHKELLLSVNFERVFYFTPESLFLRHNEIFEKLKLSCPNIQHISGLPDIIKLNLIHDRSHKLLIIDDLMNEFLSTESMVQLLSVDVHHFNISVIFTLQNFYAPSKFGKTIARNVNYRVLFYNRMDLRETRNISLQISNQPNFLLESFEFLLKEFPHRPPYIIIDGHFRNRHKFLFVKSHIFPANDYSSNNETEFKPIFFFPKPQ